MAALFAEDAVVAVVPPEGSSAGSLQSNGKERLRDFLRWCLHKNFRIEQTRDHQVEGTSIRSWLLATADRPLAPATDGGAVTVKGRVE